MSRGPGVSTWLAEALEPAEPLLALLTQTGDTWLLGLLVALLYVLGGSAPLPGWDRRRGAAVLAAGLLAISTTGLLKAAFGLPRPPGAAEPAYAIAGPLGDLYAWTATADGFGFPSGHALGSTAIYGTVAGLVARAARRRAVALAGALIATASLTRVGLGVHYFADVLAGVVVGLVLAALAIRWVRRPGVAIGTAVPIAAGWAVLADNAPDAAGALGLSAGALVAWIALEERLVALPTPRGWTVGALAVGGAVLAGVTVGAIEVGGSAVAAGVGLVGMALLVALPLALEVVKSENSQKVSR